MPDIIKERLDLILEHANVLVERSDTLSNADELIKDKQSQILLDSLITRYGHLPKTLKKYKELIWLFLSVHFRWRLKQSFGFATLLPSLRVNQP